MKKFLIVTIEFLPQKGGIANYLAGLARHLPSDKVVILAPKANCNKFTMKNLLHREKDFENQQAYKIYRKNLISQVPLFWPKWLPMIWHLFRVVRREKVEAILVGQVLPVGTAAFLVKKFLRIPYFVSCHGMDILLAAQESPRKKKLLNKILTQADRIIANSQFTKNELQKIGVAENKITIVYPCPTEVFARITTLHLATTMSNGKATLVDEVRRKYHLENKKVLLTVGRLVKRKGHDKVIEALPKILEHVPDAMYVVVGSGPQILNIKYQISKLGLEKSVVLTGEISNDELACFYELCDVFVMVPRQIDGDVEGFGTVFLEANQYSKPVVAGRSGGVAEAVVDGITGLLVNPTDTVQISQAVIKLLTDKQLAKRI